MLLTKHSVCCRRPYQSLSSAKITPRPHPKPATRNQVPLNATSFITASGSWLSSWQEQSQTPQPHGTASVAEGTEEQSHSCCPLRLAPADTSNTGTASSLVIHTCGSLWIQVVRWSAELTDWLLFLIVNCFGALPMNPPLFGTIISGGSNGQSLSRGQKWSLLCKPL